MLAIRISTANVLAELCEAADADVGELVDVVGADPRIGRDYLQPGLGYGGSCLPKDLRGLALVASDLGLSAPAAFLGLADRVNDHQRRRTVRLAVDLLGDPRRRRVAVLGVTFKPGSDDLRDSPALDVARQLRGRGADVVVHDPAVDALPDLPCAASAERACDGADLVLVLTDWPEYGDLDPARLAPVVRRRVVLDARRLLDRARWRRAGWEHWALGVDDVAAAHAPGDVPAVPA